MQSVSAVILAGGRSSRMGSNKALLKLDKKSIIQRQVEELAHYYDQVMVVSNEVELYKDLGVQVVKDEYPGSGPLAGIHAGLLASSKEGIFVLPCDMPFVPGNIGLKMLKLCGEADGLVLEKGGHLEPLCALYSKTCLGIIEEFLQTDRRKVIDFYPMKDIKIIPAELLGKDLALDRVFFNINTPDEYQRAQSMQDIVSS
jgi:molybdenum cofactor guanylyltransferase